MRVGYALDVLGHATERLEIVAETTDNRYVVRHFTITNDLYDRPVIFRGSLRLIDKEKVKDIKEE